MKFVVALRNLTNGAVIIDRPLIGPIVANDSFSWYFIASLFGTNSPNINVKKDNTNVIITIAIPFHTSKLIAGIKLYNTGTSLSANASDANALDRKPARVIPTCIVAKN